MKKYLLILPLLFLGIFLLPHTSLALSSSSWTFSSGDSLNSSGTLIQFSGSGAYTRSWGFYSDTGSLIGNQIGYGGALYTGGSAGGVCVSGSCAEDAQTYCNSGYCTIVSLYWGETAYAQLVSGVVCYSDTASGTLGCVPPAPPAATISLTFPTATTTQDFSQFLISTANLTSTDQYETQVIYSLGVSSFYDNAFIVDSTSTTNAPTNKSVALANLTSSTTWNAQADLIDVSQSDTLISTSSIITFTIAPGSSSNSGIYSSSTFIGLPVYATGTLAAEGSSFATSTCSWTDVACNLANVGDNILNFVFGWNSSEVQTIAGFNLATQQPFAVIPELETDFASLDTSGTTTASSSLSANIGNGNFSLTFFDPTSAKTFLGAAATPLRALLLAFLYLLMVFGFYQEIKAIFETHA